MKGREAEEKSSLPLKGIDPSLVDVGKLQEEALARVTSAVYRIPPLRPQPRLLLLSALAQAVYRVAYCGSANYGMSPPCVYVCVHVCMCIWFS